MGCAEKVSALPRVVNVNESGVEKIEAREQNTNLLRQHRMGESTAVSVHRCRFVDFCPSAITALAFSPLTPPSTIRQKPLGRPPSGFGTLAVGHTNGTIDIHEWTGLENQYSSPQAWTVRKVRTYPSVDLLLCLRPVPEDSYWPLPYKNRFSCFCHTIP
jgi:hypothetical protein